MKILQVPLLVLFCVSFASCVEHIKYVGLKNISRYSGVDSEGIAYEKNYYISQYLKAKPIVARSICKSFSKDMDLVVFESRNEFLKVRIKLVDEIQNHDILAVGGFVHNLSGKLNYYWTNGVKIDFNYDGTLAKKCLGIHKEGSLGFISISCDDEYLFICQDLDYQYAQ
jgi:hypothetical protein